MKTSRWASILAAMALCAGALLAAGKTEAPPGRGSAGPHDDVGPARAFHERSRYAWPFAAGPHYGELDPAERRSPDALLTPVGSFRSDALPAFPAELTAPDRLAAGAPFQHYLLQVEPAAAADGALESIREAVLANGGAFVGEMPVAAFVVRLTPAARQAVSGLPGLLALLPYHPALKLHPSIGRIPLPDPEAAGAEVYDLDVRVFEGMDAAAVAGEIAGIGGEVTGVWPDTVRVRLHRSLLPRVAGLEAVERVFEHSPLFPQAEETSTTIQTGALRSGTDPYHDHGVDGTGEVLMVIDSGISLDAGDLSETHDDPGTPGPAHRKVLLYETAIQFEGDGDLLGCDDPGSGGRTHGHIVAATALGNGTDVDSSYGVGYQAIDGSGSPWLLDGVAPRAKLVAYDAHVTPVAASCEDPAFAALTPGDLYSGTSAGSLAVSYDDHEARTAVISWGGTANTYDSNATDIDDFLHDKKEAMVFVAAGNQGSTTGGVPDEGTLVAPATTKNGLAIGVTGTADDPSRGPDRRWQNSGVGPAPGNRVAPQLMAPGVDFGTVGIPSEFACRSTDNDQDGPVECDISSGNTGSSLAAAAAAGAAMVVRSYFAGGFYPTGEGTPPAVLVPTVSGALVKAILVASADWVGVGNAVPQGGSKAYRFNNEQGYGRIQLDNALPLQTWPYSKTGLIVADLGIQDGENRFTALELQTGAPTGTEPRYTQTTIHVGDDGEELRVALAWVESEGENLLHDLDLEVCAPAADPCTGTVYYGNYFTDDNDRNGSLGPGEDCPGLDGSTGALDGSPWSLPACGNAVRDTANTTEAVFLSPDPGDDGPDGNCSATTTTACSTSFDCPSGETCQGSDNQIVRGDWTVRVIQRDVGAGLPTQRFAVAMAGGIDLASRVQFDRDVYSCNDRPIITVYEFDDPPLEPAPIDENLIQDRVLYSVQHSTGPRVDTEADSQHFVTSYHDVNPPEGLTFVSDPIVLSAETAPDTGNGVLDVRHGDTIQVYYLDPGDSSEHTDIARIDCNAPIDLGGTVFDLYGTNASVQVAGGCEVNARGNQEFGFPDRYLDAGERASLRLAFTSPTELVDATVSLRCVIPDLDSPAGCAPGSTDCDDPERATNLDCPQMTILDPERRVGLVLANQPMVAAFDVVMAETIPGEPTVELLLALESRASGKTQRGMAALRQKLDVDEAALYYSTDFPTGGYEAVDWDNDELLGGANCVPGVDCPSCVPGVPCVETQRGTPTSNPDADLDYRFEVWGWSDLTAGTDAAGNPVARNTALGSPWNFDTSDGGFRSGRGAVSSPGVADIIANWGEDLDFDGVLDGLCTGNPSVGCESQADCDAAAAGICDFTLLEDRDSANGVLDQGWSTLGGCGWQTAIAGTCAGSGQPCYLDADCGGSSCDAVAPHLGAWHTGVIGDPDTSPCMADDPASASCERYDVLTTTQGLNRVVEFLLTPEVEKVHQEIDADGVPLYEARVLAFDWNASIDITDGLAWFTWELDNDLDAPAPVDLTGDGTVLGAFSGPYGAVRQGDFTLTEGYPMFAALDAGGLSYNGNVGINRVGGNSCFFEGPGTVPIPATAHLGLARPADDDCDNDRVCSVTTSVHCCEDADCPLTETCGAAVDTVDEFVTPAGPRRNFHLGHFNGPDMRRDTIEDLYGTSGNRFQGALGFWVFEGTPQQPAVSGFGATIDDVVLRWAEVRLDPDTSDCGAQGACAVLTVSPQVLYEGNTLLEITLLETTHDGNTDCDGDGAGDGVDDCDADGRREVRVHAVSSAEPAGESVLLQETAPLSGSYRGFLPVSTTVDLGGTMFLRPDGTQAATVTVSYDDTDDGSGSPCRNTPAGGTWGTVRDSATFHPRTGLVIVKEVSLTDNGDDDGYADTNESVQMSITVSNKSGQDLEDVVAWLSTDSPYVECILDPVLALGDLAAGQELTSPGQFVFKIRGDVDRADAFENLAATFEITMSSAQFDALERPQRVTLDLDLDVSGGGAPADFFEDFEAGNGDLSGTQFFVSNLDAGIYDNALSDGYRCQYNDPDRPASNSYGQECHLGPNLPVANATYWQVRGQSPSPASFSGSKSAYFGVFLPSADDTETMTLATLEALQTLAPIDLSHEGAGGIPELSFKHRVSLVDDRAGVGVRPGQTLDRAVVQVQVVDAVGAPQGPWITIEPYYNIYDAQAASNFTNCAFDPIDDGSTEDDLYAPGGLEGPSSTCSPRYVFSNIGDTDNRNAFDADAIGRASDGPALEGSTGGGTWIESRFSLKRFQGRRVLIRFLATTIEVDTFETYEAVVGWNPTPVDDGWLIDDVRVGALGAAATVVPDAGDNSGLPDPCTQACTATAALAAAPASLAAPGEAVLLDAGGSTVASCADGAPQYQFWIDDGNGVAGDGGDVLLRHWTDDPTFPDAPGITTDYAVVVRCSADPGCADSTVLEVPVGCPSTGSQVQAFGETIQFNASGDLFWSTAQGVDVIEGDLGALHATGTYEGTVRKCIAEDMVTDTKTPTGDPPSGSAYYYLVRRPVGCNAITWKTAAPKEHPGGDRDAEINANFLSCRP